MINTLTKENRNISGIYSITNLVNGKRYIGAAINFGNRFRGHNSNLTRNKYGRRHIQLAFNKYGSSNFMFEIVNVCSKENLGQMEQYYIKAFDTMNRDRGYNLESGGNLQKEISKESRKLMSIAKKGIPLTEEHKKNISLATIGLNTWTKDTKQSKEIIEKRRVSNILSAWNRRSVKQFDLDGNFIKEFDSATSASKELNILRRSIGHVLNGRDSQTHGYKFQYGNQDVS